MNKNDRGFIDIVIKKLIDWDEPEGEGCFVSNKITKDGFKVGYMYREVPDEGCQDSGWRFFAGNEDDEYVNNPDNIGIFALNTICNYDPDIIPYLHSCIGSSFIRIDNKNFELDDETKEIYIVKQDR